MQHIPQRTHVSFFVLVKLTVAGTHLKHLVIGSAFDCFDIFDLGSTTAEWRNISIFRIHFERIFLNQDFESLNVPSSLLLGFLFLMLLFLGLDAVLEQLLVLLDFIHILHVLWLILVGCSVILALPESLQHTELEHVGKTA